MGTAEDQLARYALEEVERIDRDREQPQVLIAEARRSWPSGRAARRGRPS
jgi:hypothetical protein